MQACKSALVRFRFVPVLLALAVTLAACSDDGSSGGATSSRPEPSAEPTTSPSTSAPTTTTIALPGARFCDAGEPQQTGTLQDPALIEVSGVVASQRHPGVFWVHNDSGDQARIFAIDAEGTRLGEFTLPGVTAVDWEDITLVPNPGPGDGGPDRIVIADIGDNAAQRASVSLVFVDEPDLPDDPAEPVVIDGSEVEVVEYTYADGPHDAESIFYDVATSDVAVISKAYVDTPGLYLPAERDPTAGGPIVLDRAGDVVLGAGQLATSAEASIDGSAILVRTYSEVYVYERAAGESAADALGREPCSAPAATEQQGEAIAVVADDSGYVTISEGAGAPVWLAALS